MSAHQAEHRIKTMRRVLSVAGSEYTWVREFGRFLP
jgi:hypothetical protein